MMLCCFVLFMWFYVGCVCGFVGILVGEYDVVDVVVSDCCVGELLVVVCDYGDLWLDFVYVDGMYVFIVVVLDWFGLFVDVFGLFVVYGFLVCLVLVCIVDGVVVDSWWVSFLYGDLLFVVIFELGLWRLAGGDGVVFGWFYCCDVVYWFGWLVLL